MTEHRIEVLRQRLGCFFALLHTLSRETCHPTLFQNTFFLTSMQSSSASSTTHAFIDLVDHDDEGNVFTEVQPDGTLVHFSAPTIVGWQLVDSPTGMVCQAIVVEAGRFAGLKYVDEIDEQRRSVASVVVVGKQ